MKTYQAALSLLLSAFFLLDCKPKDAGSVVKDLASFTDGASPRNLCEGSEATQRSDSVQSILLRSRINAQTPQGLALVRAISAVPLSTRSAFARLGGRIEMAPLVDQVCRSAAIGHGSEVGDFPAGALPLDACYIFQSRGDPSGAPSLTIWLRSDAAVIQAETVRQFGYIEAQVLSRLSGTDEIAEYTMVPKGSPLAKVERVAGAYLRDIGATKNLDKVVSRWFGSSTAASVSGTTDPLKSLKANAKQSHRGDLLLQFMEFVYAEAFD